MFVIMSMLCLFMEGLREDWLYQLSHPPKIKYLLTPHFVIADSRFPFWAPVSISEHWSPIQDKNLSTSAVQSLPIFTILVSFQGFMRMLSPF